MSKYYSSSIAFGAEQTKTEKVVVSPTKIGDVTTDAVSGALTVDEVPTLDSLNPVSSDGVARAVIQAGAELPTRGSSDTGKVLTVKNSDGDLEWDVPADGIPDMTGQDGKILGAVDNSGTMTAQWVNPPESYPSVTGNAGKVLTVNGGATGVEWAAPAQTIYTAGKAIEIEDREVSVKYGSTLNVASTSVSSTITAPVETLDTTSTTYSYSYAYGCGTPVTSEIAALANNGGSATLTFASSNRISFTISPDAPKAGVFFLYDKTDTTKCIVIKSSKTYNLVTGPGYSNLFLYNGASLVFDFSDVVCYGGASLSDVSFGNWYLGFGAKGPNYECPTTTTDYWGALFSGSGSYQTVIPSNTFTGSYNGPLEVAKPLPASTSADENKVLTVNSSGNAVWAAAQGGGGGGGASYTAGQGIAIDGNNAISVDASSIDFSFGQRSTLPSWSTKYNFNVYAYPDSSVICTKDSYINLASETGNVHLVCDNTGSVAGNYAVCNTNYAFSNWRLTSDVKIEISKTASDWTFTGNTFNIGDGVCYITIAGTTGSTITPNGETPVEITDFFGTAQFDILTNPNQLSLKTPIPTVDQSYNASSTHAQSGTAVAQAISQAGGGITWSKITGSSITTTSYSMTANFSYSIPSGKTALQVTLMLRLYNSSGSWSTIPKELAVKLKLGDGNGSFYMSVGTIANATNWLGGQPTTWMVSGTVVVPCDWYSSIEGIQLELPASGGSLPEAYDKDLFVGIA